MAIYWIDPFNSTNGTGTYASPWSFAQTTRTTFNDGDEIRVKGKSLASLLTATEYTVTLTNSGTVTITQGGGLGADFTQSSLVYFPQFDTFAKIYTVSTNNLNLQSIAQSSLWPINDTQATNIIMRKVNPVAAPAGGNGLNFYTLGSTTTPGIAVNMQDGWVDEFTRVTDGSVKSLVHQQSVTSGTYYIYIGTTTAGDYVKNATIDFQNTHFMCGNVNSSSHIRLWILVSASNITVKQIQSPYANTTGGIYVSGQRNNQINVTHCAGSAWQGTGNFSQNTLYVENTYVTTTDQVISSSIMAGQSYNSNITLKNIISTQLSTLRSILYITGGMDNSQIFLTGYVDSYYTANDYLYCIVAGYSYNCSITVAEGVTLRANKRALTISTLLSRVRWYTGTLVPTGVIYFPKVTMPSNITASYYNQVSSASIQVQATSYASDTDKPGTLKLVYEDLANSDTSTKYAFLRGVNILETCKSNPNTPPKEYLSVTGSSQLAITSALTNVTTPVCSTDSTTYYATAPSIAVQLSSWASSVWDNNAQCKKCIKIPCTQGTQYTIRAYVRTSMQNIATGQIQLDVSLNDKPYVAYVANTGNTCYNNWEQLSLTFTADRTGEYDLRWKLKLPNTGTVWLSDLTIT